MGFSQQKLADMMGIKRGKVAGYFYDTQPRPEFYEKLGELFDLNIGRFLTVGITENNYDSFFLPEKRDLTMVADAKGDYYTKSELIDLLIQLKKIDNPSERDDLLNHAIQLYGKVLDENSRLKDLNSQLKDRLLSLKDEKSKPK